MRKIDINECHDILIDMAMEFHRICTKHNIPYYMLGGTMLGAIRHKGFIPWDDDMDFGIPREYYKQFTEVCQIELKEPYAFKHLLNSEYAVLGIGKLVATNTIVRELYAVKSEEKLGVNIDIFPLDYTNDATSLMSFNGRMRALFKLQKLLFVNPNDRPFFKKCLAKTVRTLLPLDKHTILNYIDTEYSRRKNKTKNTMVFNLFGAWGFKELIPIDVFGVPTLYEFEKIKLYGVENFDKYLRLMYSDYRILPPEDKRHIHFNETYIYD